MLIIVGIFAVLGAMIKYGKMYFLIAGYNTLTAEEKAKYDLEGIATLMRNVLFGMALVVLIGFFASLWLTKPTLQEYALLIAIGIGVPYLIVRANSKKYRIDNNRSD
jgi:hypothetical protein